LGPRGAQPTGSTVAALAVRLGVVGAIFALAIVLSVRGAGPYSEGQVRALYALVLAAFLGALAIGVLNANRVGGRAVVFSELGADGALISALVYCTGGAGSIFAFLYNVWIVYIAVRLGPSAAVMGCAASVAAYALLAWGPLFGWLSPFEVAGGASFDEALIGTSTHAAGFLVVTVLASGLARQVSRGRAELRELGQLHQRVFDSVSSGLLTVDHAGNVTSFNPEAERITGYQRQHVLGHNIRDIFDGALTSFESSMPTGPLQARREVTFCNRRGEELHLGFSSSLLRNEDGEPDGAILIFQDVTRVVEMEAELRRTERLSAVGQLAAGLAHEIRNPLGALSGAIELLSAEWPHRPSDARLFRIVQRETERLNRLVSEFLSYARTGPSRRERISITALFEEIEKLWLANTRREVALDVRIEPGLEAVGDPDHLRQVFWNLLLNAAEAKPSDGRVVVEAKRGSGSEAGMVVIQVSDRGTGIPREILERIFEPFFTTKVKGTGLGLATVHRLIESGGGSIGIRSDSGEGTCVRVVLPELTASESIGSSLVDAHVSELAGDLAPGGSSSE